jgi:NTP pyrophosphatase (non-canonical NTP hydrolase)
LRQEYESALAAFMLALQANGRQLPDMPGMRTDPFLATLRAANLSRVVRFGHGDIKAPHGWGPMQWGCALAGEVGELCNFLKKYQRQMPSDPSPDDLHSEIAKEIADVFIYLDLLASTFDLDLSRIITLKFNATSKKFGFPERL